MKLAGLRRRLRHLDRVRDLLLRDLGGLAYELHRAGQRSGGGGRHPLMTAKLERLAAVDDEMQTLRAQLGEPSRGHVVREPGITHRCAQCGELQGADARFCSRCGAPSDGRDRVPAAGPQPAHPPGPAPGSTAAPSGSSGSADPDGGDERKPSPGAAGEPSRDTAEEQATTAGRGGLWGRG